MRRWGQKGFRLGRECVRTSLVRPATPRTFSTTHFALTFERGDNSGTTNVLTDEVDEENLLRLRQLTSNARTLVRARRNDDAAKVIDEGLNLFPWHSALWFWKIATKLGDSAGALEVWDTMSRLGIEKRPEHYDIMASAVTSANARHIVLHLFDEMLHSRVVGNPRFYSTLFFACSLGGAKLLDEGQSIWEQMQAQPELAHIVGDPTVLVAYDRMRRNSGRTTKNKEPGIDQQHAQSALRSRSDQSISNVYTTPEDSSGTRFPEPSDSLTTTVENEDTNLARPSGMSGFSVGPELSRNPSEIDSTPVETSTTQNSITEEQANIIPTSIKPVGSSPNAALPLEPVTTYGEVTGQIYHELEPFFSPRTDRASHEKALQRAKNLLRSTSATLQNYNYVIRNAAHIEQPEELLQLLEATIEKGLKPDSNTYIPIIRKYFAIGKSEEALDLIGRMEVSNVRFDFRTVRTVLTGLFQNNKSDEAMQFFVDILQPGVHSTMIGGTDNETALFSIAIAGLCDVQRLEDAQKLTAVMVQRRLRPTLAVYSALVEACFAADQVLEGMQYFDLAIKIPDISRININWKEDIDHLVSVTVAGILRSDRYHEASELINRVSQEGYWHNTTAKPYASFISWLSRHERVDEAWNLFAFQLGKTGLASEDYRLRMAVLKGIYLDRGDVQGGLEWFRDMQRKYPIFTQASYSALISSAMYNGERDIAEKLWAEVKQGLHSRGLQMSIILRDLGSRWSLMNGGSI